MFNLFFLYKINFEITSCSKCTNSYNTKNGKFVQKMVISYRISHLLVVYRGDCHIFDLYWNLWVTQSLEPMFLLGKYNIESLRELVWVKLYKIG